VIVDPEDLNLVTTYGYDRTGRVIETIEGPGTSNPRRVVTTFDVLGRRVSETVDPQVGDSGLELLTTYRYDANGNLARKIDPAGQSTWFVYDANSQLRFTIDALGGVSEMVYDAAGQVVATRRYANAFVEPESGVPIVFDDVVTVAEVAALLVTSDQDRISQSVFDGDGREVFTINALGGVTERTYDDNGNVTRTRLYAQQVAQGTYTSGQQVRDALAAPARTRDLRRRRPRRRDPVELRQCGQRDFDDGVRDAA
jgi:YD repeat-containing protein